MYEQVKVGTTCGGCPAWLKAQGSDPCLRDELLRRGNLVGVREFKSRPPHHFRQSYLKHTPVQTWVGEMESSRFSFTKSWLIHTFIILILTMIPSYLFFQVSPSQMTLYVNSLFWQHFPIPTGGGLSVTLYPIILLLVFAISVPSYLLVFFRRRIPRSASILKYAVLIAAFTILISSRFVLTMIPSVTYQEWSSLEWFGSLVLIFLIVIPTIRWELNWYLAREEKSALPGVEATSVKNPCNPERVGRLLFYTVLLVPFAFQSLSRNPIILQSLFYDVSLSNPSAGEFQISFMGFPGIMMLFFLPALALRLFFAYKIVAYLLGTEKDNTVVIIGFLSLILDAISMPTVQLEVPFTFGPFPLLFTVGLLTMYKCYVDK